MYFYIFCAQSPSYLNNIAIFQDFFSFTKNLFHPLTVHDVFGISGQGEDIIFLYVFQMEFTIQCCKMLQAKGNSVQGRKLYPLLHLC